MSPESIVVICAAGGSALATIAGVATLLIKSAADNKKLLLLREQDRLDRESEAAIARADKAELMAAGEIRKDEIIKATNQVRTVAVKAALKSQEAIRVANNHNEKIQNAVEISKKVLETLATPVDPTTP
jgi:hypothetical protein